MCFFEVLVFDWIAGSSQVITLGEKEEELAKAKFQCKLVVGALLTFLPTFSLHNHLLHEKSLSDIFIVSNAYNLRYAYWERLFTLNWKK